MRLYTPPKGLSGCKWIKEIKSDQISGKKCFETCRVLLAIMPRDITFCVCVLLTPLQGQTLTSCLDVVFVTVYDTGAKPDLGRGQGKGAYIARKVYHSVKKMFAFKSLKLIAWARLFI